MGQHVLVSIPLDSSWHIEGDLHFGRNLIDAIQERGNPNIPSRPHQVYGAQLGPQFHSNDTFFVTIESGQIVRLSTDEQNHLECSLARYRRKKEDDAND